MKTNKISMSGKATLHYGDDPIPFREVENDILPNMVSMLLRGKGTERTSFALGSNNVPNTPAQVGLNAVFGSMSERHTLVNFKEDEGSVEVVTEPDGTVVFTILLVMDLVTGAVVGDVGELGLTMHYNYPEIVTRMVFNPKIVLTATDLLKVKYTLVIRIPKPALQDIQYNVDGVDIPATIETTLYPSVNIPWTKYISPWFINSLGFARSTVPTNRLVALGEQAGGFTRSVIVTTAAGAAITLTADATSLNYPGGVGYLQQSNSNTVWVDYIFTPPIPKTDNMKCEIVMNLDLSGIVTTGT